MSDVENELRATLERKADEAISSAENAMPSQIVRRVRRRQVRTTLLTAVTLGVLVLGSVVGVRTFFKPETVRWPLEPAGAPFTIHDPPALIGDRDFLLASGESVGEAWDLFAFEDRHGLALELRTADGGASGAGDFTVPEDESLEIATHLFGTPPNADVVIFGAAVANAAQVRVDLTESGTTLGEVIPLPSSFQEQLKIVLIEIVRPNGEGHIILSDSEGREITRQPHISPPFFPPPMPTSPPTPPFQPGDPIHQLDRFGNAVGYVPWEAAFGDPSGPPGALEEGFGWVPPGLAGVTVAEIRATARIKLTWVWPVIKDWWQTRPNPSARDEAFLEWWSAYPVTEKLPGV